MLMSQGRPARVRFLANNYHVIVAGDHVVCAVTGEPIPLDSLRYWSVVRQEPYASAQIATAAEARA